MNEQKYLLVNWKDGMKINKSHFIEQENAFIYASSRQAECMLNNYSYGLLPARQNASEAVKLFLSMDNEQQVHLRLRNCLAITKGGYYIELDENMTVNGSHLSGAVPDLWFPYQEIKGKAASFYVVLTMNPYDRIAHGLANPQEQPARIPYTMPAFYLSLMPEDETTQHVLGLFQLPVGKLKAEGGKLLIDESYIPPCSCMNSHTDLMDVHAELEQFYSKIETCSLKIIQKIIQQKENRTAVIFKKLCENILIFTGTNLVWLRTLCLFQPPVETVCMLSSFARIFKITLDCYSGGDKEELMDFCERMKISRKKLEESIAGLANHQYNHLDVYKSIDTISHFTHIVSSLFSHIAELEHIGIKGEKDIYISQNVIVTEPEKPFTKQKISLYVE